MSNYNSITYTDLADLKSAIITEFSESRRGNDKSNYGEKEKPEVTNDLPVQYQTITSDFFNQITTPLEVVNEDAINYDDEQNKIIYDISDLVVQTANLQGITNFYDSSHGCDGGCAGLCYDACYKGCKGCSGYCGGACDSNCYYDGCTGGCGSVCASSCNESNCQGRCETVCQRSCSDGCGYACGDCTGTCSGTCTGDCTLTSKNSTGGYTQ